MTAPESLAGYLDPRDRAFAETLEPGERDVVVSTVSRYRRPERLRVGDALPAGAVHRLGDGTQVSLESLGAGRPLVLVFGSFT